MNGVKVWGRGSIEWVIRILEHFKYKRISEKRCYYPRLLAAMTGRACAEGASPLVGDETTFV